jgi:hypothetical protein
VHYCRPITSIEDDKFEEVPSTIWAKNQLSNRILVDLFNHHRMLQRVKNVCSIYAVPESRRRQLHGGIVLQNQFDSGGRVEVEMIMPTLMSRSPDRRPHESSAAPISVKISFGVQIWA